MENTTALLLNTVLKDRSLWFDGDSTYDSSELLKYVQHYDILYVDKLTSAVAEYNKHVTKKQELRLKTSCRDLSFDWDIPSEYVNIDIVEYIFNKHDLLVLGMSQDEVNARDERLVTELVEFKKRNLLDVVRTLIYIINTLTNNKSVWGLGRGSSVSSYLLYVISVHDVDSYAYDLDINDFFHD